MIGPIVVGSEKRPILVAQFERRVLQRIRNTERAEAWSKTADDDAIVTPVVTEDEAGDDNIASTANECARTEIRQSRAGGRIQIVDFDEANACPSVVRVAAHNRGVS